MLNVHKLLKNNGTVSKGHADGLIEAMSKFVMEKIIEK